MVRGAKAVGSGLEAGEDNGERFGERIGERLHDCGWVNPLVCFHLHSFGKSWGAK